MTKGAMLNVAQSDRDFLYRREQMSSALAEADAVLYATEVLDTMGLSDLLYARVDLVATIRGWLVMELELVRTLALSDLQRPGGHETRLGDRCAAHRKRWPKARRLKIHPFANF